MIALSGRIITTVRTVIDLTIVSLFHRHILVSLSVPSQKPTNAQVLTELYVFCTINVPTRGTRNVVTIQSNEISDDDILSLSRIATRVAFWKSCHY